MLSNDNTLVGNEKVEEENECFSMATNLILPSSFPSYQPEKNEVVCIQPSHVLVVVM